MHPKTYKNLNEKIPSINFLVLMGNLHYCDWCLCELNSCWLIVFPLTWFKGTGEVIMLSGYILLKLYMAFGQYYISVALH